MSNIHAMVSNDTNFTMRGYHGEKASFYFFKTKPIILKSRYERWRSGGLLDFITHVRG